MYTERLNCNNDSKISTFNITWQSANDGPGKRLVLFLQGCPLSCKWCHSPHSIFNESPLLFFETLCTSCTRCSSTCPNGVHSFVNGQHRINRKRCTKCGACVEACPQSSGSRNSGALVLPTRHTSTTMLFEAIRPQLEMLKKVGGITFSGGEPLLQADAVADLAKRCKQIGINIAIETSGVIAVKELKKVLPYVDTWLIGMRLTTGHSSSISPLLERKVRRTLKCLQANTQNNIIVRIPVIPGYTSTLSYLQAAQNIVKDFSLTNIELLPQNPEGEHYYKAAGLNPLVSFNKHEAEESYQYATNFFLNNKLS